VIENKNFKETIYSLLQQAHYNVKAYKNKRANDK